MSRFKRLTDAEARTLTRRELLDRIEAEQAHWFRKKKRTGVARSGRTFSKTVVVITAESGGRRVFGLATAGVRLA